MAAIINNLDMYISDNNYKYCEITLFNLMPDDYYFQFNLYDTAKLSIWEATNDDPSNKCRIDLDVNPALRASPFPGSVNLKKLGDRPLPWFVTPKVLIKKNSSKVFSFFVNDFVELADRPNTISCYTVSDFTGRAVVTCPPVKKDPRKGGGAGKYIQQGTEPVNVWFQVLTTESTWEGTSTKLSLREFGEIYPHKPFTPADLPYNPF